MKGRRYKLSLWLVLAVYMVMSAGVGDFFYVCATEEGQFKLEYALQGGCSAGNENTGNSAFSPEAGITAEENSCGSCTDTNLSLVQHIRQGAKAENLVLQHGEGVIYFASEQNESAVKWLNPEYAFSAGSLSACASLRCVVLLI